MSTSQDTALSASPEFISPFRQSSVHTDFLIRIKETSDTGTHYVDLYTVKALLVRSSEYFSDMLAVPQPPGQTEQFVEVQETELVWDRLLRWIDPFASAADVETVDDIALILEPVKKYLLDKVKPHIITILARLLDSCPSEALRIWALAIHLEDRDLVVTASRATLAIQIQQPWIPCGHELEAIPGHLVLELFRYRQRCRDTLQAVLLQDPSQPSSILYQHWRSSGLSDTSCKNTICCGTSALVSSAAHPQWLGRFMDICITMIDSTPSATVFSGMKWIELDAIRRTSDTCMYARRQILWNFPSFHAGFCVGMNQVVQQVDVPDFLGM
ncbi:hypothetical protein DL96DRAFT_1686349 [Flagelloscypha sp. PMI_526]|nr:hypothetical protein DL96DRAFT_1686349 [Flagelloscypha sp. PMI_526]